MMTTCANCKYMDERINAIPCKDCEGHDKWEKADYMLVTVLGTTYHIKKKAYKDDPMFAERSIDGYCDDVQKLIVYCDMHTFPGCEKDDDDTVRKTEILTLRHEIVHAFLSESGLAYSSLPVNSWAKNEEMVDWFALQGRKICDAWEIVEDNLDSFGSEEEQ